MQLSPKGAIVDLKRGDRLEAGALAVRIAGRARDLAAAGVADRSTVLIAHGGSIGFFVDLFAVWSLKACAACVNPDVTLGELRNLAAFTQPAAILYADGSVEPCGNPQPIADHGDAALILFTSGTTGDPKGVVHTVTSLSERIALNRRFIAPETLARTLCILPTHFGHGLIGNCLTPLAAGGDLFLMQDAPLKVAGGLGVIVADHAISFMSSVPSFWKLALKASKPPHRQTLRQVSVGSAPVAADLVRRIADWSGTDDVRNMYGITETANWIAGGSLKDRPPEDGLIGPMWGGEAAVRGEDGSLAATGSGEIVVRTPSLMAGYLKRPDLTSEAIVDGWYRTGDTGTVDETGVIRLAGRIKTEINRGGMKVAPEEIDLLLERHPDVTEACAFGQPDPVAGEVVAVAVRRRDGSTADAAALRAWCRERIRRECVPECWYFLPEIPKTDRGKLNRALVRDACLKAAKS